MVTAAYRENEAQANGLTLRYQEWGAPEAPPIIMLHGFGVSGHMFDEFAQRLQERYRLISLDQRGHGDSDWSPDGDYTREAFVADLEAFRASLGIDQFVLVGHSMGGLNAVSYTARFPQHVSALVLVDVGPEFAHEGVDNIARFTGGPDELEFEEFVEMAHRFNQRRTLENIRERMRHRLKPSESGKWTWKFDKRFRQPDVGLRIGGELSNDQSWELFRDLSVPVLIVRGGESDVLTQEVAERAAREMVNATLRVVPGAGHSVPGDNPDDFTFVVRSFLDGLAAESQPVMADTPPGPTLEELVGTHASPKRRAPGSLLLAAGGAAAVLAAGATIFALSRKKGRRSPARTVQPGWHSRGPVAHSADLEWAQRRALDLVNELATVGRDGVGRARHLASEVDLERAKAAALDVLKTLGDEGRKTPRRMRKASHKASANTRKRRVGLPRLGVRTVTWLMPLFNVGFRAAIANSGKVRNSRGRHR